MPIADFSDIADLWLECRADALGAVDGDVLTQFSDASGNGRHLALSGGGSLTYRAQGAGGLPGVELTAGYLSVAANLSSTDEVTVLMLVKINNANADAVHLAELGNHTAVSGFRLIRYGLGQGNRLQWTASSAGSYNVREGGIGGFTQGQTKRCVGIANRSEPSASETAVYLEGSGPGDGPYGGANLSGNFANSTFYVGGAPHYTGGVSAYLNGVIVAVVVYSRALNDTERSDAEALLLELNGTGGGGETPPPAEPLGGSLVGYTGVGIYETQVLRVRLAASNIENPGEIAEAWEVLEADVSYTGNGSCRSGSLKIGINSRSAKPNWQPWEKLLRLQIDRGFGWETIWMGRHLVLVEADPTKTLQVSLEDLFVMVEQTVLDEAPAANDYPLISGVSAGSRIQTTGDTSELAGGKTWRELWDRRYIESPRATYGYGPDGYFLAGNPEDGTPKTLTLSPDLLISTKNEGYALLDYTSDYWGEKDGYIYRQSRARPYFAPIRTAKVSFDETAADVTTSGYTTVDNIASYSNTAYYRLVRINLATLAAEVSVSKVVFDLGISWLVEGVGRLGMAIWRGTRSDNTLTLLGEAQNLGSGVYSLNPDPAVVGSPVQQVIQREELIGAAVPGGKTWQITVENPGSSGYLAACIMYSDSNSANAGQPFANNAFVIGETVTERDLRRGFPAPASFSRPFYDGPTYRVYVRGIHIPPLLIKGLPGGLEQYAAGATVRLRRGSYQTEIWTQTLPDVGAPRSV